MISPEKQYRIIKELCPDIPDDEVKRMVVDVSMLQYKRAIQKRDGNTE